jgi:hypothetical protein
MSRMVKLADLSLLALLVGTFAFGHAPKDAPKTDAKTDEPIYLKVNKPFDFPGIDDPKWTLSDALELLSSKTGLVFEINETAFAAPPDKIKDVGWTPIAETTPIRPMKNVRLETVLRKIFARLPVPTGATYTIRRDRVEITTVKAQQEEFYRDHIRAMQNANPLEAIEAVTDPLRFFPLVHANFDKKPLDEALKDLADRTDVAIVLDVRAVKDNPIVSARLTNTPLDTAVQLLAEMSDLRSVAIGKTLFVTTGEKAKRIYKQMNPLPPGGMSGVIGAMGEVGVGPIQPPGNFRPRINPCAGM